MAYTYKVYIVQNVHSEGPKRRCREMASRSDSEQAEQPRPLKPAVFQILLALAEEESHGYAIMSAVRERSGGAIRLETGPLYRHLKRMLDDGLVEESDRRPSPEEDDERRRYYRLTTQGRVVLTAEGDRLAGLVRLGRRLGVISG